MTQPLGIQSPAPIPRDETKCWDCLGSGRAWYDHRGEAEVEPCGTCNGTGTIPRRWAP